MSAGPLWDWTAAHSVMQKHAEVPSRKCAFWTMELRKQGQKYIRKTISHSFHLQVVWITNERSHLLTGGATKANLQKLGHQRIQVQLGGARGLFQNTRYWSNKNSRIIFNKGYAVHGSLKWSILQCYTQCEAYLSIPGELIKSKPSWHWTHTQW